MIVLLRLALGPIGAGAAFALSALLLLTTLTQCSNANAARGQFKTAEAGRVKAVGDLAECRADLSRLDAAVDAQNQATRAYQTEVERRLSAAQEAVQAARRGSKTASIRAGRALSAAAGQDLCHSLDLVMLESVR